jgi:hypothetical protein
MAKTGIHYSFMNSNDSFNHYLRFLPRNVRKISAKKNYDTLFTVPDLKYHLYLYNLILLEIIFTGSK